MCFLGNMPDLAYQSWNFSFVVVTNALRSVSRRSIYKVNQLASSARLSLSLPLGQLNFLYLYQSILSYERFPVTDLTSQWEGETMRMYLNITMLHQLPWIFLKMGRAPVRDKTPKTCLSADSDLADLPYGVLTGRGAQGNSRRKQFSLLCKQVCLHYSL